MSGDVRAGEVEDVPATSRMSATAGKLTESVIREMTRLAIEHEAINLAQGFPDFPAPDAVKQAAVDAICADYNQYPITWGQPSIRLALQEKYRHWYGMNVDPEQNVCITCGATEAMIAAMIGCLNPGDEVVVFEPFYENYGADAIIAGATPRYITLREPGWTFDESELSAAFATGRVRAVVINDPNNPTGKVFSRTELTAIAELCQKHGAIAITDEIYEHITYDDVPHIPIATIPGMEDRAITISALSKTYAVTGWRVGWVVAPPALTAAIRKVHDFLTVGAPAPLQAAGVAAMGLPRSYYEGLAADYQRRRDLLCPALAAAGFTFEVPQGAYYVLCSTAAVDPAGDDVAFARRLVREVGVAGVPGSSFRSGGAGRDTIRFAFPKKLETLSEAAERLRGL